MIRSYTVRYVVWFSSALTAALLLPVGSKGFPVHAEETKVEEAQEATPAAAEETAPSTDSKPEEKPAVTEEKPEATSTAETPASTEKPTESATEEPAKPTEEKAEGEKPAEKNEDSKGESKPDEEKTKKKKSETKKKGSGGGAAINAIGNLLRRATGGGPVAFQAPTTPEEAIKMSFQQLEQQLNQQSWIVGPDGKPQQQESKEEKKGGLPEEEQKEIIEQVKQAVPLEEFEKLPAKRQQEIIQALQNTTQYWVNPSTWRDLGDTDYRKAGREWMLLQVKRLLKMPVIESEDPEGVKKQIDELSKLIVSKVPKNFQEFLEDETVKAMFVQQISQQMNYQMNRTDNLSFKMVTPEEEFKPALEQLDKNLENFNRNNGNNINQMLQNYGLGEFANKSAEERKKLLATPQGRNFGNQLYYMIYPLQQFGGSLSGISSTYAKRTKYLEVDLTGGIPNTEMMNAQRKFNRLQQNYWNNQRFQADRNVKDPEGVVKHALDQVSRYGSRQINDQDKLTPEQLKERREHVHEAMLKVLKEELPDDQYSKLDSSRQGRILQAAQQSAASALDYNSPGKVSDEERDSALLNLRIAAREALKMPKLAPEGKEITEKQIEEFVAKLLDETKKLEPELMSHDSLRSAVAEQWKGELATQIDNDQSAAFKTPMSPERFQVFLSQIPLKFKVFAAAPNSQIYARNDFNLESFKKMPKEQQAATLEDQNIQQMAMYTVTGRTSRLIENMAKESESWAKSTRFKSTDLSAGISNQMRQEQNTLAERAREVRYQRYLTTDPNARQREADRNKMQTAYISERTAESKKVWERTRWLSGGVVGGFVVLMLLRQFRISRKRKREAAAAAAETAA